MFRRCVEKELLKCPDPTPANVVNSLLLALLESTPCDNLSTFSAAQSNKPSMISIISVTILSILLLR